MQQWAGTANRHDFTRWRTAAVMHPPVNIFRACRRISPCRVIILLTQPVQPSPWIQAPPMRFNLPGYPFRDNLDLPNIWDFLAIPLVLSGFLLIAWGSHQMTVPYNPGEVLPISLDPANLPAYALRTTLRMGAAMLLSLLFTFTYATLAAKSERAGMVMIPVLDVLQSVPILGFLSITVVGFISLFQGSLMGPEAAPIF